MLRACPQALTVTLVVPNETSNGIEGFRQRLTLTPTLFIPFDTSADDDIFINVIT